ncbi:hypothetical protein ACI6PS_03540 [Flavobacterium sp. PLA-1-15]|uniref:hypothetical protein n=1 Tax=Flavobacterium sp. PLA-1-15 TaxID=3380533 RepID=UPI003B77B680
MREFIKSLVDSYSERIKNPLLGSFTISFILFNWRPIFILLFSDEIMESKIQIIDTYYCNVWAMIIPFIVAVLYVIALPYINLFIGRILGYSNTEKYKIKEKTIDNNMGLRKKQALNERELADLRAGTSEINELKSLIEALNEDIKIKNQSITEALEANNLDKIASNESIKQIRNDRDDLLKSNKATNSLLKGNIEIIELLSDFSIESKDNILKYIEKNIDKRVLLESINNDEEVLNLDNYIVALFVKADLAFANVTGNVRLTEKGYHFIRNINM